MKSMRALLARVMMVAIMAVAAPAAAQFSESFNFLKAVKDKDGAKATEILDKPGNTVVNTRDTDTGETGLHIVTNKNASTAHFTIGAEEFQTPPVQVNGLADGMKVGLIVSGFFKAVMRVERRG